MNYSSLLSNYENLESLIVCLTVVKNRSSLLLNYLSCQTCTNLRVENEYGLHPNSCAQKAWYHPVWEFYQG